MDMTIGVRYSENYADPKTEMVIVRYAAHPIGANAGNDPLTLPAFHAVATALMAP